MITAGTNSADEKADFIFAANSLLTVAIGPSAAPIVGLAPGEGEAVIHKHLPSAFTGTGLLGELQTRGVETLIIAGYMTHNCVDSTAREAFHRGYRVGVVADACATRDLPGPDGQTVPAAM